MPRLLSLKPRQIIKFLEANGFVLDHTSGSHLVFRNHVTKRRTVVPLHNRDIPKGTLLSLLKEAGFTREEIVDFFKWIQGRIWSSTCIAASKCGFGYRTNDTDLTQFATSTLYAGFTSSTPGSNVASSSTGPVTNDATTITYRMSIDTSKPAGNYSTTIIYLAVPVF